VVVAQVPWARHGAGHTCEFDAQVAWLVTQCSKRGVSELMRIAWHSVGAIIERVWEDTASTFDRFADLTRIGVDEISYKRGHKYLTVVVNHDTGSAEGLVDLRVYAASVAVGFMMSSNSMGVSFPSRR